MAALPADLNCNRCGRSPLDIPGCPDKSAGCPFIVLSRKFPPSWFALALVLFFIVSVVLGMPLQQPWLIALGLVGFVPVLFARETVLFNPLTHTKLRRRTVFGIMLSSEWTGREQSFPIHLAPTPPLPLPASTLMLAEWLYLRPPNTIDEPRNVQSEQSLRTPLRLNTAQAVLLFRAAVLGLLRDELLRVYQVPVRSYAFGGGQPIVTHAYLLASTGHAGFPLRDGALKQKIMFVLDNWQSRSESREWPTGPSVSVLVREVYGSPVANPENWLGEIAAEDLARTGACHIDSRFFGKDIIWNPHRIDEFKPSFRTLDALSAELEQKYPDFSSTLDRQIEKGIRASEDDGGD